MLGLVQLCLLLYIRQKTLKAGKIDMESIQEYARRELKLRSNDQTKITVSRLEDRGFVKKQPAGMVSYVENLLNERIITENIELCNRASTLAGP